MWWSHVEGNREGVATFFAALSRAKQRAIFTFYEARGALDGIADLYQLLADAGVPEADFRLSALIMKGRRPQRAQEAEPHLPSHQHPDGTCYLALRQRAGRGLGSSGALPAGDSRTKSHFLISLPRKADRLAG
jgi:hypothetical protein